MRGSRGAANGASRGPHNFLFQARNQARGTGGLNGAKRRDKSVAEKNEAAR